MVEDDIPEGRPNQVAFTLIWHLENGQLRGELTARNTGDRPVRLTGKPGLTPLGLNGRPLDTQTLHTLEWRAPGHVVVAPGSVASAHVGWGSWDGPPASGIVRIRWAGGEAEVRTSGPRQPAQAIAGGARNLTASWFELGDGCTPSPRPERPAS